MDTFRKIWVNGRLFPRTKAFVSVENSAYLYGQGVFETLKAQDGKTLFIREHFERIVRNAALLGLQFPLSFLQMCKEIDRTLKANQASTATIRMTLSQEGSNKAHLVILIRPYVGPGNYHKGGKLILIRSAQADPAGVANIKTTSYLTKMIARMEIADRQAIEGIFLNADGHVTEGASSNLFVVKGGILLTPPLSEGLLPGTRRGIVLKLARKLRIPSKEKALSPGDLKKADEIFVTSSLKDIFPITKFEGKKIGSQCPGPLTQRLRENYARLLLSQ